MIAVLEVLGAFGLETALVQRANVSREHFDSVWTFNLLFGLGLGVIVIALAWPVAFFYGDPRLFSVLIILALNYHARWHWVMSFGGTDCSCGLGQ